MAFPLMVDGIDLGGGAGSMPTRRSPSGSVTGCWRSVKCSGLSGFQANSSSEEGIRDTGRGRHVDHQGNAQS